MKIAGDYPLPLPPDRAYALLQDPAILARCMPGCEGLERIAEGEYAMRMKMVLASISGKFAGKVVISEPHPPVGFRMLVEGSGKIGFMKGDGAIGLAGVEAGTLVHYEGEVQVGGVLANVGQRLVETTAKMLIKRFFENLVRSAAIVAAPGSAAPIA